MSNVTNYRTRADNISKQIVFLLTLIISQRADSNVSFNARFPVYFTDVNVVTVS